MGIALSIWRSAGRVATALGGILHCVLICLMTLFALLSLPLAAAIALSLGGAELMMASRKGLLSGAAWFIGWAVVRIVFSDVLIVAPLPSQIYLNYTFIHLAIPLMFLLPGPIRAMRRAPDPGVLEESLLSLQARLWVFFFLNSILDIYLFPIPGIVSRLFVLPLFRVLLVFLIPRIAVLLSRGRGRELWFTLALSFILFFGLNLGLVAEFYRMPWMTWFHALLSILLMYALYMVRLLSERVWTRISSALQRLREYFLLKLQVFRSR